MGAAANLPGDPDFRRDEGAGRAAAWAKAAALYARAEAELEAVAHTEDDDLYDRALGRHNAALARLLRAPAPDLAAVLRKLDLILRHQVFELSFGEAAFAALRADVQGLAGLSVHVTPNSQLPALRFDDRF
jgi:hypothetical protein